MSAEHLSAGIDSGAAPPATADPASQGWAVRYLEPDGDQEKLTAVRQGGTWKLLLKIPKAARPAGAGSP